MSAAMTDADRIESLIEDNAKLRAMVSEGNDSKLVQEMPGYTPAHEYAWGLVDRASQALLGLLVVARRERAPEHIVRALQMSHRMLDTHRTDSSPMLRYARREGFGTLHRVNQPGFTSYAPDGTSATAEASASTLELSGVQEAK